MNDSRASVADLDRQQDAELIGLVATRDRAAIKALFERHNLTVYRFLHRMVGNQADAEELMNETFLEVWRVAGTFEGRSKVSSWMLGIARFKALSALRKRTEAPLNDEMAAQVEDADDTPEVVAMKGSKAEAIALCLSKLSSEHREVVDLVYYHEKSIREVSEIVGIPENTVKTRMFHARKRLSALMKSAGIDRGWP